MNNAYASLKAALAAAPKCWAVTGAAGFIASHLVEELLKLDQTVVGLDNFATGYQRNLDEVRQGVTPAQWGRFTFVEGDICALADCRRACEGADYVLHQAALGSVPRSITDPMATHNANVNGFINLLMAARDARVKRFVYASSSAVYGDHPGLPKTEGVIGRCLSPYAASKHINEIYADVFGRCYGLTAIGLRYFNVFGQRQDPEGPYAAVIPKWIAAMLSGEPVCINGDGDTSRDFCYVLNVVQANLLAACTGNPEACNRVYNVALNERTSLNQLFTQLRDQLAPQFPKLAGLQPVYREFRAGDVRHSQADISAIRTALGFQPSHNLSAGLATALAWYVASQKPGSNPAG